MHTRYVIHSTGSVAQLKSHSSPCKEGIAAIHATSEKYLFNYFNQDDSKVPTNYLSRRTRNRKEPCDIVLSTTSCVLNQSSTERTINMPMPLST